ncbi:MULTISPECIES: alpha/beta hydrolase [Actinoplanes]|uniref:alpha/beta hydrolase n=1 Tax=Actinoplanes TaxID=1865 RepID=UPI000696620D|nr:MULTISPECIES: alpha/beta hydrolase [Actinoplanes]GLY02578.1 hypothetical protein Acsp01_29570 [Actinoplanes sp. NBRC 101535]
MHPQAPRRTTHAYGTPANLLVYDRWGRFGRPVVLLHGLLYDRTMWWPVAADMGGSCSVLAVDLPGHGQSAPRGDYAVESLAQDLAMIINGLDLHRAPVLVAHAESVVLAEAFADSYATKTVISVDVPATAAPAATVESHLATADLGTIPEPYRQFAVARRDASLLHAYRSWFSKPRTRRASSRPVSPTGFPHLRSPARFARSVRDLV